MNLALSTSHRFTHTTRSKSRRLLISRSRGQHSAIRICIRRTRGRSPSHPASAGRVSLSRRVNSFLIKVEAFQSEALRSIGGEAPFMGNLKGKIKWACSFIDGESQRLLKNSLTFKTDSNVLINIWDCRGLFFSQRYELKNIYFRVCCFGFWKFQWDLFRRVDLN